MELIETKEFFQIDHKKIEVLVHSQSIVHALICFCDGGMLAHLSAHDMKHAINYALNWPSRKNSLRSGKNNGNRVRLICCLSASTCAKSVLKVRFIRRVGVMR